ncbi:MAG: NADH-quinone oxidoreductase subunit NuoK [bacterium]|nr:NADH-quinone oxidoreductase subunit NuoK [bacterium]
MQSAIPMEYFLVLSAILFTIGCIGVIARRNIIVILMSLELILNAVNINFVTFSYYLNNMTGRVFSLFTMAVAAAEVAIGLAIAVNLVRVRKTMEIDEIDTLKW